MTPRLRAATVYISQHCMQFAMHDAVADELDRRPARPWTVAGCRRRRPRRKTHRGTMPTKETQAGPAGRRWPKSWPPRSGTAAAAVRNSHLNRPSLQDLTQRSLDGSRALRSHAGLAPTTGRSSCRFALYRSTKVMPPTFAIIKSHEIAGLSTCLD